MGLLTRLRSRLLRLCSLCRLASLSSLASRGRGSDFPRRLQPAPLAPRRLERRRVLDAGAAELLFCSCADSATTLEIGGQSAGPASDILALHQGESGDEASAGPADVELFLGEIEIFEHDVLQLGVTFEDPNDEDAHTAIVDWGDGTAPESFTIDPGARFLGTSHQYRDDNPGATPEDGNTIEVTILDASGNRATASAVVTVKNIAPNIDTLSVTPVINEGQIANLRGTFSDPGTQDTFELDIDWDGDLQFDQTVAVRGGEFHVSRRFLDDNPSGSPSDTFNVNVRLRDDDTGADTDQVSLTVRNVNPEIPVLAPFSSVVNEGADVDLLLIFGDRGILDTHTIEVDWGDDTEVESIDVPIGGSNLRILSHVYLDDSTATPSDFYQIRVVITDDDGGQVARSTQVTVNNVPPMLTISGDPMIDEGSPYTLSLGSSDPGDDTITSWVIDWGDGTVEQVAGNPSLAMHSYADDGNYSIRAAAEDEDGSYLANSFVVAVNNVAPVVLLDPVAMIYENGAATLSGSITDPGRLDTFTLDITWGDPLSGENTQSFQLGTTVLTESAEGIAWDPVTRTFTLQHQYLDDNPSVTSSDTYTIDVRVTDDDAGEGADGQAVLVKNESPLLVLDPVAMIYENGAATLRGSITDPGSLDTFTLDITWGDPLSGENTQSFELGTVALTESAQGIVWDPVTRTFSLQHQYLDDNPSVTSSDTYTIDVRVTDDDSGAGFGGQTVLVKNASPTFDTLSVLPSAINESESVTLSGTFSDVGSLDLHRIDIRWGDGTIDSEGGTLAFTQESSGSGSFIATHTYLDNDTENPDDLIKDNIYSITVIVTDDDGGQFTQVLDLEVRNVNPALELIAQEDATDVNSRGETSVTITFSDIGADRLNVWVDWGDIRDPDNPFLPGDDPFVVATIDGQPAGVPIAIDGPATSTITLTHTYTRPPNPLSPAADIVISVVVVDDDFDFAAAGGQVDGPLAGQLIVEPGRSAIQTVTISNAGIGTTPIAIDTTPQVPRLIFPLQDEIVFFAGATSEDAGSAQTTDLNTAVGDTKSTTSRYLELRVIDPASGVQSEGYRLKPEVLNDLPGLFRTLPDNHYAIYLVRTETNTRRLVIEVYVRNGKLIDPGDDSEGTRDRPPTDEATPGGIEGAIEQLEIETQPDESLPLNGVQPDAPADHLRGTPAGPAADAAWPQSEQVGAEPIKMGRSFGEGAFGEGAFGQEAVGQRPDGSLAARVRAARVLGSAAVGLAASQSARSWAERIDQAIATADSLQWRRLRRRQSHKRK